MDLDKEYPRVEPRSVRYTKEYPFAGHQSVLEIRDRAEPRD